MSSSEKYGVFGVICVRVRGCIERHFSENLQFRSAKEVFAERRREFWGCSLSEGNLRGRDKNRRQNPLSEGVNFWPVR